MGGVSSIQVYFGLLELFNFAKPLRGGCHMSCPRQHRLSVGVTTQ